MTARKDTGPFGRTVNQAGEHVPWDDPGRARLAESGAELPWQKAPGERPHIFAEDDKPWAAEALCGEADGDAWYSEDPHERRMAKAICHVCPVRQECLDYAVRTNERWGIWGGLSQFQRRKLRRRYCRDCGVEIPNTKSAPMRCEPCRASKNGAAA